MPTILFTLALFIVCIGPARADLYEFDKLHTQILFFVDHFGFSKSQGEFLEFAGEFSFDENNFQKSEVDITIFANSIDMDDAKWNQKMKGEKYFHVERYPTISFTSTMIDRMDDKNAIVHGNLTLLGQTLPIEVHMTLNKVGLNLASGKKTAGFSGRASLHRSDFGMNTHLKFIGNEVEIRLEVEGFIEPQRRHDS